MLLKSIRLKNFRQYKGIQTIEFSTDPSHNVTVILGNNTFGKTTLLQAFNWCLYQNARLDNPDQLLNYDIAGEMANGAIEEVEVKIKLVHNSTDYEIITTQEYERVGAEVKGHKPKTTVSYMRKDGQSEPVKEASVKSVIQSILPEDLSDFFFFDTERVANVGERKDLTDSVKTLLGLSVLGNALAHIGSQEQKRSVIGKFYQNLDLKGNATAATALQEMQEAKEKLENVDNQLEECDAQIAKITVRKEQLSEILRNNNETKALQKQKEELEKKVANWSADIDRTTTALRKDFSQSSLMYFVVPLADQAEQMLKDAELDDKGIKDLTQLTLEEILARGTCVCGTKFDEHPDAIEHVKKEMKLCPPESIGTSIRNYREALKSNAGNQADILYGMHDRQKSISSARVSLQEAYDQIDEISDQLNQKEDLGKYEYDLTEVKKSLMLLNEKRDDLLGAQGALKQDISNKQKDYEKVSIASEKNRQIERYIAYAEEVKQWISLTYSDKEKEIRETLEERVNSIFEQMYHGSRKVVIDSKYHVELLSNVSSREMKTGESEGLNRVKSFAFIAGLVSMAKEKIVSGAGGEEFDLSSEPYPLVMDAPFSNTDDVHIGKISKVLPEASEQVVMFVMHKDWLYAKPVLESRVGKSYQLDKLSEQHSVLRGL